MNLPNVSRTDLIAMYYGEGLRYREMAERIGCSAAAICLRMREEKLQARTAWDYPMTEKQQNAYRENGKRLGKIRTTEERRESGHKNKGHRWKDYEFGGHEKKDHYGYVLVFCPDHPHATKDGYVRKHTLVMERELGRYLMPDEVAHHINRNRSDNRIENLQLMSRHDHQSMHSKEMMKKRKEAKNNELE